MDFLIIDEDLEFVDKLIKKLSKYYQDASFDYFTYKPDQKALKDNYSIIIVDLLDYKNSIKIAQELKMCYLKASLVFISKNNDLIFDVQEIKHLCFIRKSELDHDLNILVNLIKKQKDIPIKLCFKLEKSCNHNKNTLITLSSDEIIFVECYLHNIIINTSNGQYVVKCTLKEFMKMILNTGCFVQIHRTYVINMNYVYKINDNMVNMIDEKIKNELDIGRKYKRFFLKSYENFLMI